MVSKEMDRSFGAFFILPWLRVAKKKCSAQAPTFGSEQLGRGSAAFTGENGGRHEPLSANEARFLVSQRSRAVRTVDMIRGL